MTFHMPPIVFFYGEGAIGFSETVRVTENGCEVITNFERKLFVK
jgi:Xaa-Pro aminopeptidase